MIFFIVALTLSVFGFIVSIVLGFKTYKRKNKKIITKEDNRKYDNCLMLISVLGLILSSVALLYTLLNAVPTPTIYPLDNETRVYSETAEVTINTIPFFRTYYSLDGSDPKDGYIYEGTFTITQTATVSARNKFFFWWSDISKSAFNINSSKAKDEIIKELKKEGVQFNELWIAFYENDIEVWNTNGEIENCFGKQITNLDTIELKLINNNYQIYFSDYIIENRDVYGEEKEVVIFNDIPSGYYNLETNINGYEFLITKNMNLTADYLQGDISKGEKYWGRKIYMTKNNSDRLLPYCINVIDSKGNEISGLMCSLVYENPKHLIGNYKIENGRIQLNFMAHKGSTMGVIVHDTNDIYYEIRFDDINNYPVVIIE